MEYYSKEKPIEAPLKAFINIAKYSPDGKHLALLTADKHIRIIDTATNNLKLSIDCTKYRKIRDIDFARHSRIIGAAADNVLALFGNPGGKLFKAITPERLQHHFKHVHFGYDNVLAGTTENYLVYIYYDYALPDPKFVKFIPHYSAITSINFISHSSIITSFEDGLCIKWNSTVDDRDEHEDFQTLQQNVRTVKITHTAMSPDNTYVLLTHLCSKLTAWKIENAVHQNRSNQRAVTFFKSYTGHICVKAGEFEIKGKFMFHGEDKFVISGSENHFIYIWQFESAELLRVLNCQGDVPVSIVLNPSANLDRFAVLQQNGQLFIWKKDPVL